MLRRLEKSEFDRIFEIMESSFPVDERRPYEGQKKLLDDPRYRIYVKDAADEKQIAGFAAVWELNEMIFLEHLAVDQHFRNHGIGAEILRDLAAIYQERICLEAEPPVDELTCRRIRFYERNHFSLNEYPYMQPALAVGQEEVPLMIMTTGATVNETEFKRIRAQLYKEVYRTGCRLCPRECGADRKNGDIGYCGVGGKGISGARAALHMWEEPCISGEEGSGTVFFSGCPLRCVYCQNYDIAHAKRGTEITVERLAEIFLELQGKKANNINLVTPTHYSGAIKQALLLAKKKGLRIPIVYNCSGYEKVETLKMMSGLIDIYLTDFKYMDENLALKYSRASNYPEIAKKALDEMVFQCGEPEFDERGMMKKGVIVRHLLLPGQLQNGKDVVKYVYETYGNQVFISLMNQYTPLPHAAIYPELNRRVTEEEYDELVDYAIDIGIENGFIQEGETAEESFIPDFDNEGWEK